LVPGILYKDSSAINKSTTASGSNTNESVTETSKEDIKETTSITITPDVNNTNDATNEIDEMAQIEKEIQELEKQVDESNNGAGLDDEQSLQISELTVEDLKENEDESTVNTCITGQTVASSGTNSSSLASSNMKALMDSFIAQLPNCVNRELIDKAAKEFLLNLNTKLNRKRLVGALFQVQRTRLDLLPFYSRFLATLNPCMPEMSTDLATLLQNDFRFHVRKKDQINIESKIKTARFIGELVKFNMFPKLDALNCLKTLLADFKHHNIEMACNLLDVCGRYLYRNQESHQKLKLLLVRLGLVC
jgi:regulator of nonsense transcripts 2